MVEYNKYDDLEEQQHFSDHVVNTTTTESSEIKNFENERQEEG